MSDTPANKGTTAPETASDDPSLGPRRLVAFIISFVLGVAVVELLEVTYLRVPAFTASFPIAFLPEVPLWPLAGLSMGFFFLIWVDFFMGTRIIPD